MADFQIALEHTLRFEDSTLSGVITSDTGGCTRFGISQKSNPDAFPAIEECSRDQALEMAGNIYRRKYWKFDGLVSQLVANKIFDMAVNMGSGTSIRIAQRCSGVPADGAWGPITETAVNRVPVLQMLKSLRAAAEAYYDELIAQNPGKYAAFKEDWLARAKS